LLSARLLWKSVLVNGDDLLYRGPKTFSKHFYSSTGLAGFTPSVGKNFLSSDFCQINSKTFVLKGGRMTRQGYLNQVLTKDLVLRGDMSESTPERLSLALSDMVRTCPWSIGSLKGLFDGFDRKVRVGRGFKPNWYLPPFLGGYGLARDLQPRDWFSTPSQRFVAAAMICPGSHLALFCGGAARSTPTVPYAQTLQRLTGKMEVLPESKRDPSLRIQDLTNSWLAKVHTLVRASTFDDVSESRQNLTRTVSERCKEFSCGLNRSGVYRFRDHGLSSETLEDYRGGVIVSTLPIQLPPSGLIHTSLKGSWSERRSTREWQSATLSQKCIFSPLCRNHFRPFSSLHQHSRDALIDPYVFPLPTTRRIRFDDRKWPRRFPEPPSP
jgi:hypothetical protein